MRAFLILVTLLAVASGACMEFIGDDAATSIRSQGLQTPCDPFSDPDCHDDTGGGGGGGGGGGFPTGGGGGCPVGQLPDGHGHCLQTSDNNRCGVLVGCDPTLGIASQVSCQQTCVSLSARCYYVYRCGTDPDCPEAHVGYCGVF